MSAENVKVKTATKALLVRLAGLGWGGSLLGRESPVAPPYYIWTFRGAFWVTKIGGRQFFFALPVGMCFGLTWGWHIRNWDNALRRHYEREAANGAGAMFAIGFWGGYNPGRISLVAVWALG